MKKRNSIIAITLCAVMCLTACGGSKAADNASVSVATETETATQQEATEQTDELTSDQTDEQTTEQATEQQEPADNEESAITEDQAYAAVINYNKAIGSGYDGEINDEGYTEYWDVSTNEDGKIVVLYRSYTGAQIRHYVDPVSGETYITELVPGIIDEEQETGDTFNARDYLTEE